MSAKRTHLCKIQTEFIFRVCFFRSERHPKRVDTFNRSRVGFTAVVHGAN